MFISGSRVREEVQGGGILWVLHFYTNLISYHSCTLRLIALRLRQWTKSVRYDLNVSSFRVAAVLRVLLIVSHFLQGYRGSSWTSQCRPTLWRTLSVSLVSSPPSKSIPLIIAQTDVCDIWGWIMRKQMQSITLKNLIITTRIWKMGWVMCSVCLSVHRGYPSISSQVLTKEGDTP